METANEGASASRSRPFLAAGDGVLTGTRVLRDGWLPIALLSVYVVAFACWLVLAPIGSPVANILSNLGGLVPGVAAIWLSARAASEPTLAPQLRRGWRWLTASFALFWLGDAAFLFLKIVRAGGLVGASSADVLYLSSYPLALVGLLFLRSGERAREERASFWLDAAMVALGGGLVAWQMFVYPTLVDPRWDSEALTAAAYVVTDVTLLVALVISGLGARRGVKVPVVLLGLGLTVRFCANGLYWYDVLLGPPGAASAGAAALYNVAWLVFGATAHAQRRVGADAEVPPATVQPGGSAMPTAAATIGFVVLALSVLNRVSLDLGVLVFGGVALTAAVLARQLVAVRAGARHSAQLTARRNEARFRSLVENASDIILVVAEDAAIRFHTPSAERLFKRKGSEIDGMSLLDVVHPEDRETALALVADAIARPGTTPAAEWRVGDGEQGWQFVEARANSVPGDPFLAGAVLTLRGIHERKVLEARLAHQAFHDPLTNLANRLLFTERLEHALRLARRGARPVTVIFIDLDDFKNVNDTLGHAAGDHLLVELAHRLLACVRLGDTAARLGGDEFAVLVEEGAGLDEAWPIAERLLEAVQRPLAVAGARRRAGREPRHRLVRGGRRDGQRPPAQRGRGDVPGQDRGQGAGRPVRGEHADRHPRAPGPRGGPARGGGPRGAGARLPAAGGARLRPHRRGRGPAAVEPPQEGPPAPRRLPPGGRVRRSASRHRALGRGGGLPVRSRLARARRDRRAAPADGERHRGFPGLGGPRRDGRARARRLGPVRGSARRRDDRERRSRGRADDVPRHAPRCARLGVRMAVDDFGTGYSSLSYLRDMPIDILKLDKLFVDGVAEDSDAHLLTRGIVDLARTLGKLVVAEGIEREDQAARLREYGCTLGQGYLFSRPLSARALQERLEADPDRPAGGTASIAGDELGRDSISAEVPVTR